MITREMEARGLLLHRRRALLSLYRENAADARELREANTPDWADRAPEVEEEAVLNRLSERERSELHNVDAALQRLAQGRYGRCEGCGKPISAERLRALPEAIRCLACSRAAEAPR